MFDNVTKEVNSIMGGVPCCDGGMYGDIFQQFTYPEYNMANVGGFNESNTFNGQVGPGGGQYHYSGAGGSSGVGYSNNSGNPCFSDLYDPFESVTYL